MQLFSYLCDGLVRSARLVGELGIDLNLASVYFNQNEAILPDSQYVLPIDLSQLLSFGKAGLEYAKKVTDWVVSSLPEEFDRFPEGLLFEFNEVTLTAPIIRPGKVICIAGNYPAPNKLEKPEFPTIFLKPSGGVVGNNQAVILPAIAENVAYEVELAIVIGKRGKNLSPKDVHSVIAGYTLANDLGDRNLEKRTSQWTSGKMFDTFTPMGPVLITPDELSETNHLDLYTRVNDQIVQKGSTSQMFFDVPQLVIYLSSLTTLEPGDVILTGSPKLLDGAPNSNYALKPEDVVIVGIENSIRLVNPIVSEKQEN
jgi:acylpyruvate hydrolase